MPSRAARNAGKTRTDSEGKITGPGGKGKDAETVAATTVTGAGIGAIAGGGKGAGIGAGIGGLAGLAGGAVLTRGPEAQLPRGSSHGSCAGARLAIGSRAGSLHQRRTAEHGNCPACPTVAK